MFGYENIDVNLKGQVLEILLSRPKVHNALNQQLISELTSIFLKIRSEDPKPRTIVLTGKGPSFCAGADLTSINQLKNSGFDLNLIRGQEIFDLMLAIDECPLPVVGKINGSAFGGGIGIISCCDIALASEKAIFGFSEVRLGLVPAVISSFVIAKIGRSRARELFLTGERFSARFAQLIGLVHHVCSAEVLDDRTDEIVQELLQGAAGAQSDVKRLLRQINDMSAGEARAFATDLFARRWSSEEAEEGITAFLEKRNPSWKR